MSLEQIHGVPGVDTGCQWSSCMVFSTLLCVLRAVTWCPWSSYVVECGDVLGADSWCPCRQILIGVHGTRLSAAGLMLHNTFSDVVRDPCRQGAPKQCRRVVDAIDETTWAGV